MTPATTTTPTPRMSRRGFLTGSLAAALGVAALPALGALTACSPEPVDPDQRLLGILGDLRALDRDGVDEGAGFFAAQADRLSAEIVRQCGTEPADSCTGAVADVVAPVPAPAVADLRPTVADALTAGADDGQVSLLTGLYAALGTVDDRTAGGEAVDWSDVDHALTGGVPSELEDATARIHEAVWLTGRLLPTAGSSVQAVTTVAERLRRLRDAALTATGVPAAAGYTFPTEAPGDAAGTTALLLDAVHAVTVDLRRATAAVDASDRGAVAMWCLVSARCEAALEDASGTDPLSVPVRGE